jgi:UDP-N-acetylglucosamine 3-dehydrogenase
MTRVAVVGVGVMGKNHVRVYQEMPEVDLVAIVDKNCALAEQVSRI